MSLFLQPHDLTLAVLEIPGVVLVGTIGVNGS